MRIAIVGAGAAGAAAAYGCRDAEVVVFEAADRVGGGSPRASATARPTTTAPAT
ncbi:FAD-dependent oxidoreductase [Halosegnis marinus]|uniref:FAD-dependent oxidoreductase n=1 Tax=Halosegnis marinus TaxID=3034023 RepID=UPI003606D367